ncbi:unnamed protein product [Orchesella dallaii]|uniref:Uncharacterized protein n=1 Tax=Orchesella dallaii TaxID=48710 RepID=A0ABP1QJ77_9HEXA
MDSKKDLSILNFLESYDRDILVREYVDKLLKYQMLPFQPDQTLLESMEAPNYTLSVEVQKVIIPNFFWYFQKRYFEKNTMEASDRDIPLFSPIARFNVPQYQHIPLATIEKLTEDRKIFAVSTQYKFLLGNQFSMENQLLQIWHEITTYISSMNEIKTKDQIQQETHYFYLTFFLTCKTEFFKKYRMRNIDWDKKEDKVKPSLPRWRKENLTAPNNMSNRYSAALVKGIEEGRQAINANTAISNFTNLTTKTIAEIENNILSQNSKNIPTTSRAKIKPYNREPVKNTKSFKRQLGTTNSRRSYNPKFNDQRDTGNSNVNNDPQALFNLN